MQGCHTQEHSTTALFRLVLLGFALCRLLEPGVLHGKDYFLTIAGGYSPAGNQASLEANVLFVNQVLATAAVPAAEHWIYFASGNTAAPDLQSQASGELPPLQRFYADLFDVEADRIVFRSHRIPNVRGGNTTAEIRRALSKLKNQLQAEDRLVVYVTAHGGRGEEGEPYNTEIHGWDQQSFRVSEFADWLDELPPQVPVIMVMTQCYSGGFAHGIFKHGSARQGLSPALRAGFFGQKHNLAAAGCRNDVQDDQEYSSYFWGALIGHTRSNLPLKDVDCNGDQRISLAEAHTCAVLRAATIDLPLRASDALLMAESRLGSKREAQRTAQTDEASEAGPQATPASQRIAKVPLLRLTGTLTSLSRDCPPDQVALITGLARQLKQDSSSTVQSLSKDLAAARQQWDLTQVEQAEAADELSAARKALQAPLLNQWPDLAEVGHPADSQLLADLGDTVMEFARSQSEWPDYSQKLARHQELQKANQRDELRVIKFKRLLFALRMAVLAKNLPQVAPPEVVTRYQQMLALEESTLR